MTYSTFYESKYWAATLILRRLEVEDSRHSITSTLASYVPALWSILGDKEAAYQDGTKKSLMISGISQVLIPWCWITSLVINIPHFFVVHLWYFDANHPLHCNSHEKLVDHSSVSLRLALGAGSSILMAALYSRVVYALWFSRSSNNEIPPQQQVVLKVRKRITLMVISVTVIFGICWNARATLHLATSYSSFSTSGLTLRIAHIMLMFNAAVNIFAYVLISQRFRVKIKKILCPGEDSERARHPAREPQGMEIVAVVPIYQTTENEVRVED
ncbi:PREDICTED: uncharacterized protein LOC107344310 isoform X2 [Acropora digitifera]|uniref:uncharacterized protein LOC107344310 isoform X2 n=1 Tax=Acropora digitifera TaxID=70779 RepID=UPI00077A0798|nr:PREDICTED: uncharacterized protein LOC107344310 isoform X2 [Acropora digitifera]